MESCFSNPAVNCSFYLSSYGGIDAEINLVGAVVPLIVSGFILVYYRKRIHWLRVTRFTLAGFTIITGIGSAISAALGTISLIGVVYIIYWFFMVWWYSRFKAVRGDHGLVVGELYVVGTLSVFLDDFVRTLAGFVNIPILSLRITSNIWGAGGPAD